MNYTLELNAQDSNFPIIFHNILFDAFKINIIERYTSIKKPKLSKIVIKIRTLDDEIIKTKTDTSRIVLKDNDYVTYEKLSRTLSSYEYRKRLINQKQNDQEYVDFVLQLVIKYYPIN